MTAYELDDLLEEEYVPPLPVAIPGIKFHTRFALLAKWTIGFVLASLLIWLYGAFALTSAVPKHYDATVAQYVPKDGQPYRFGDEGWGYSVFAPHGIQGDLPHTDQPVVIFWGDSFVEARQVDAEDKMHAVFTRLAQQLDPQPAGIAVGFSGWNVGDVHLAMPRYVALFPHVRLNVLLVSPLDFQPDNVTIVANPQQPFTLKSRPGSAARHHLTEIVYNIRADALNTILRHVANYGYSLRFGVGPLPPAPPVPSQEDSVSNQLLQSEIAALKSAAGSPLLIILRPLTPRLRNGEIDYSDPQVAFAQQLETICQAEGVGFVYPLESFQRFTQLHFQFTHGFPNTKPDAGHLNEHGHRLIAEAALEYLKTHQYLLQ